MRVNIKSLPYRIFIYAVACGLSIAVVNFITTSLIHRISTTSSMLFPVLTISLMGFHIMIACFMGMKYLCDKKQLYLAPIAFAFTCSALLMLGTIGSYSDWLVCAQGREINQNDALIFYFFRNVMMAILFIAAIFYIASAISPPTQEKFTARYSLVVLFLSAQRSYYRGSIPATRRC